MKMEIRENSVHITGYVNAVERLSKPITEKRFGKIRTFLERIKSGVFKTALKRNDNVLVLLNHDDNKELANTKDGSAILIEDSIGLRADVTITDPDTIEKAKQNRLVGWSFGFYCNSDEETNENGNEIRTVLDLDLKEVSILDDTKTPAYNGTSIEAREDNSKYLEIRESFEEIEIDAQEQHSAVEKMIDNAFEEAHDIHMSIEAEKEQKKMELLAELIANKIIEKMGTGEEKTIPEPVTVAQADNEKRSVFFDYSIYEDRISKL